MLSDRFKNSLYVRHVEVENEEYQLIDIVLLQRLIKSTPTIVV